MELLDFARGPAMEWAFAIFIIGVLWRLFGIFFLHHRRDLNEPRHGGAAPWWGAVKTVFSRMWPRREFRERNTYSTVLGYVSHIGLAIVVFGGAFHLLFIRDLFGVSWPALPTAFVYLSGVVALVAFIALLVRRITHPVLRLLSNFDDYFSWFVAVAPLVTGLMAVAHLGARYETLLAIHILSFQLLLVWFPFGKLMHAFLFVPARAVTGYVFTRRGAAT
ncbi:nitrate reductase subunit gamma [Sulfurifustis variabilis]|uniref:Nitrate reductase subunit gamma n=1 Tax=Sulfurifustis variabilis TaxID=1675686 RepID=A0A1B4V5C5_9GAMM|nr:nitrate reductase [Sulfurifustis variabilis]BAU48728.1 nitrate reductase subunit gamma [Sulfurifustis variabilis]